MIGGVFLRCALVGVLKQRWAKSAQGENKTAQRPANALDKTSGVGFEFRLVHQTMIIEVALKQKVEHELRH